MLAALYAHGLHSQQAGAYFGKVFVFVHLPALLVAIRCNRV
jgi:hypothetical protein